MNENEDKQGTLSVPLDEIVSCVYARYLDDGPNGIYGQMCSITDPWDKLLVFKNEDSFRKWAKEVQSIKCRKNPRVSVVWGGIYENVINI